MNWAFVTLGAVILLCGCAQTERHDPPPATGSAAGAISSPPAVAKDGDRVAACRDADCEVTVHSGTKIPLSRRFGMGPIAVTVDGEEVSLRTHSPGTDTSNLVTAPGTVTLNDIVVDVIDARDDVATLRISVGRALCMRCSPR